MHESIGHLVPVEDVRFSVDGHAFSRAAARKLTNGKRRRPSSYTGEREGRSAILRPLSLLTMRRSLSRRRAASIVGTWKRARPRIARWCPAYPARSFG